MSKKNDRLTFFFLERLKKNRRIDGRSSSITSTTPVESQNTTEVQFQLFDDLDRNIVDKDIITLRIVRRPVAHLYKSKDMFFTHALTTKQVDALKDENSEIWESEERHWIVPRNLQKFKQHKIHDWPTRKRLHCSDYDPSLQNVNVAIDFSSVEHRDWWRWKVQSFKRQEIASYTWPSSTHQQNSKKRTIK